MLPPLKTRHCIFLIWIIKIFTHCESDSKVNRNSAEEICTQYGGLLSYQFLLDDKSCQQYRSYDINLSDGESAWVAENVNYSKFVSWQGCYSEVDGDVKATNISTGQNIYMCLSLCKDEPDTNFIGLGANDCRCMTDRDLKNSKPPTEPGCGDWDNYTVMPGSANITMNNFNPYGKNIPVYKIHEHVGMTWDVPFDKSFGQCIYLTKLTDGLNNFTIKQGTSSCYSKEEMKANGFICLSEQPFPNDTCTSFYCVKSNTLNWLEANKECRHALNGNLTSSIANITEEMKSNMQINIRYWTGIFRDFMIVSETPRTSDTQVCLSVRNNSNRLVFEPNDCSEQKQVLCDKPFGKDDITNDSESKTDFQNSSYLGLVVIVSLTFNGLLLLIIGICAGIFYRKTRRRCLRKKTEKQKERAKTTYDHIDLKTNTLPKDGAKSEQKNQMQTQK